MSTEAKPRGTVLPLASTGRDAASIVDGLCRRSPEAAVALYDRVGERVNRLVWRLLGADPEHDDVVHQVFVNALDSIGRLRHPGALDTWIVAVTVNTVRLELRRRRFRRLLRLDASPPEACSPELDPEQQMLARRHFAAFARLGADERIAFTLRVLEGVALTEVAAACGCSVATAKRRVARAIAHLERAARQDPVLAASLGVLGQ